MTNDHTRTLVDQLAQLAADPSTAPWPARLYAAAAVWLEGERERQPGDDRTSLTIAIERVKKKGSGEAPRDFAGCVRAWLGEVVDGVRR
jgi:hypothetical protein